MPKPAEHMILGAFVPTAIAGSSWRLEEAAVDTFRDFEHYRKIAQKLEEGCFHALFFNDSVDIDTTPSSLEKGLSTVRWDPLILAPALAISTHHIGLITTASTTYNEPYNLARKFASLDHLSGGRVGWNLVTSLSGGENFNQPAHRPHADRYDRASEFFDVVTGLWDSWEDDAFIQDKASGTWVDTDKLHTLNHHGKHFQVKGPLNTARPVQGYPVIAQAGSSDAGKALAARAGELIFTAQQSLEDSIDFCVDIKRQARHLGRPPENLKVLPGLYPVVGTTLALAEEKYERLQQLLDPKAFLSTISRFISLDYDLSELPFDAKVPMPPEHYETNTHQSRQRLVFELIRKEKPTVRQLFDRLTLGGHRIVIGTPEMIADDMQIWFEAGAGDGFNVMFSGHLPAIEDFVDLVVPELQRRGLFRKEYQGVTLRENLGLPYPHNRHMPQ